MAIVLEDLKVTYSGANGSRTTVLDIPRFQVDEGSQVCLRGGSGQGKTTLLNVIAGITMPTSGRVLHGSIDIAALKEARRDRFRAENIGYVFQTFNLLQGLSALENVLIAAAFAGHHGKPARERGEQLLERMGLTHRSHARPGELSVGEQQRVSIARAVVNRPEVVLADEPTANLDEDNSDEVLELLKEVTSEVGSILILVTHESRVQSHFEQVVRLAEISR